MNDFEPLIVFGDVLPKRTFWISDLLPNDYRADDGRHEAAEDDGNLVSSLCDDGRHMPILDLDVAHRYVPSSTPGHGHLYLDVPMEWPRLHKLLDALLEAGIIEPGFHRMSVDRGACYARKPGVTK